MISGFVLYRSGYFDSTPASDALQVSPNGGEIHLAQVDQDSTKAPQINQNNAAPIMPSSKLIVPVLDGEKYLKRETKTIMPSTKSGIRLIEPFKESPDVNLEKVELKNPYISKSKSPSFDQDKVKEEVEMHILPSSKSMTFPIEVKPEGTSYGLDTAKQLKQEEKEDDEIADDAPSKQGETVEEGSKNASSADESTPINWRGIWIGVLGILFVAAGSIVYFKRRSK